MSAPGDPAAPGRPSSARLWAPISAATLALDQLSKAWIVAHFRPLEVLPVLPVLNITLRYNRGAAWSILEGASGWQRWLFSGLAIAVGAGIVLWLRRLDARTQRLLIVGLGLILAGALGNLADRLRIGHVIDFIEVHWRDAYFFPAFNVADSAITVGAALLLLDAWLEGRRKSSATPAQEKR